MARQMKESGIDWVGEIPVEWKSLKLKYTSDFKQNKYTIDDGNLQYIGLENIIAWSGQFIETDAEYDREQALVCESGDILFGKLRPYLAKVYISPNKQCCSGEFCVISVKQQNIDYMWYQLISHGFIFMVDRSTYGTKMPRANADFIKNMTVVIPPIHEQQAIANYLHKQCASIDAVLEKTRITIEEYKKLKQSIVAEAVTKGIQHNRQMKPSGVDWIGKLPADWKVQRGKRLFVETNERSIDGHEELLTVSHITGVTPRSMKNVNMFMAESLVDYKVCHIGDLAANTMWMWQGAIGVSKYEGVISPSYNTYRQRNNSYYYGYLEYLLRIPNLVATYAAYSTGITASRLRLYPDQFFSIMFPVPPMSEQKEIADYLDKKCAEIDTLISKKTALLGELENYKKSIIYEYVTGKKEVQ